MPLTQLDDHAALVVIDLQQGIVAQAMVPPAADIVARAAHLLAAFRAKHLPVVLVNVAGRSPSRTENKAPFAPPADWATLVPELDVQSGDILVTKHNVGAFYGTGLDRELRRRGVTQIFLCGISTSSGVEATARNAYDRGYNVVSIIDAMTETNAEAHEHAIRVQLPKISEVATTDDVLARLRR
jgi:nicotinamidase-related amidase